MSSKIGRIILISMITTLTLKAQFRLPQIDVEAKGMFSFIDAKQDNINNTFSISGQGAAHIQINQHIAIGAFYARSFTGDISYSDNNGGNKVKNPTKLLFVGGDLRFSAGRSVKWRPYLSLNYSKVEFVETQGATNLATTTNAMGANIGVMLRLGNNLYWNVLEVGAKLLKDKIYWLDADLMIEAKMGFTYNIRIKNK